MVAEPRGAQRTCASLSSPDTTSTVSPRAASVSGELEQERALADARVAADQHQRAGHDAAAQHAVQLARARCRSDRLPPTPDRGERSRRRGAAVGSAGAQRARVARAGVAGTRRRLGASTAVFQAPQAEQRPNQRDSSLPHAEQKKWGGGFAMSSVVHRGSRV